MSSGRGHRSAATSPPVVAGTVAAAGQAPRPVKVLELERIRQWCPACGRVTPTLTESSRKTFCFVCWEGSADDDGCALEGYQPGSPCPLCREGHT